MDLPNGIGPHEGIEFDLMRAFVEQGASGFDLAREHESGEILSYTPEQVDIFLQHAKKS